MCNSIWLHLRLHSPLHSPRRPLDVVAMEVGPKTTGAALICHLRCTGVKTSYNDGEGGELWLFSQGYLYAPALRSLL